jgi:hypothetical protein
MADMEAHISADVSPENGTFEDTISDQVVPSIDRAEFTFRVTFSSAASSNISGAGEAQDLKWLKGHPDGPTPPNSPQKKCTRAASTGTSNLPSTSLLFPPALPQPTAKDTDIFSGLPSNTSLSGGNLPPVGPLFRSWGKASTADQVEQNH